MPIIILRIIFLVVTAGLAALINLELAPQNQSNWTPWLVFFGTMAISVAVIAADMAIPRKRLDVISSVYFGMIVGLFLTYILQLGLSPFLADTQGDTARWFNSGLAIFLCYLCISLLIQTKDDFRFIIPYVEFAKEIKGLKPYILDTSVIIDGRIADVVETEILDNQLVMPRFVIAELQNIADSSDKLRRARGRRGLDILNRLRMNSKVDLNIYEQELPEFAGQPVDAKLVLLAKSMDGKVVTNDYNLNKVAKIHGVGVLNLNDLANALKPALLPGENISLQIVKAGEEAGQGVGYLDDGTMIVVEGGRESVGKTVLITVTSMLQTSAGRMIFGRLESTVGGKS